MIALEDRHRTVQWLEGACRDGARLKLACEVAGIDARTVHRHSAIRFVSPAQRPLMSL